MKFHHIGIIVKDIGSECNLYSLLGYNVECDIITDNTQFNKIVFLINPITRERIELIEPIDSRSTVYNLPKGYTHMCYQTEDLETDLAYIKQNKLGVVITKVLQAPAINNNKIVFIYLKNRNIIELVEIKSE